MFKTSLTTCKVQIKIQILTKNFILKHLSMYRTIRTILRYDTIHMIHTLYRMIYEHLRYQTFYAQYDRIIRYVLHDTDNYACTPPSYVNYGSYHKYNYWDLQLC